MKKKLYILYIDKLRQPYYGYHYPVSYYLKRWIEFWTINNFKKFENNSLRNAILQWLKRKNFFGYWTSYRRWEESMKHAELLKIKFKTLRWLLSLI